MSKCPEFSGYSGAGASTEIYKFYRINGIKVIFHPGINASFMLGTTQTANCYPMSMCYDGSVASSVCTTYSTIMTFPKSKLFKIGVSDVF